MVQPSRQVESSCVIGTPIHGIEESILLQTFLKTLDVVVMSDQRHGTTIGTSFLSLLSSLLFMALL